MARGLMYSSVYFHKTVRIAELMLSKAIESVSGKDPFEFFKMTDSELIEELKNKGDFQYKIITRLKYRKLFKQAYSLSPTMLDINKKGVIRKLENDLDFKKEKEQEIEQKLNIPNGHVIIDVPSQELYLSEPRIDKVNIQIIDEERNVKTLSDFTPVADAVKSRVIPDWIVMIVTDEKYRSSVSNKAEKILFD
jgi:HD superfamily phosphohydrolase